MNEVKGELATEPGGGAISTDFLEAPQPSTCSSRF